MRRLILIPVVAVASVSACFAAATTLGLTTGGIAAGNAATGRCDTDGFVVSHATSGGNVSSVTVADIADPGCEGGTVRVTLTDASRADIGSGSGTVPTDGDTAPNSLVIAISPTPAETDVSAIEIAIEGP